MGKGDNRMIDNLEKTLFIDYEKDISDETKFDIQSNWLDLMNSVSDSILVLDSNYIVIWVNRAFCNNYKLSSDKVVGKKCCNFIQESNEKNHIYPSLSENKKELSNDGCISGLFDGRIEISTFPIKFGSNDFIGSIHVIKKLVDDEWNSLRKLCNEKLHKISEMTSPLFHDLNQPLQAATGFSELLISNVPIEHPFYKRLITIREQIDRIADITKKLSKITKECACF
jgi:nitrogen-specific signal transduction histidine kinase